MAIFNEILAPRYSRALQKLFGMKGGAAVRQLAGELNASIPLFYGREHRWLEDWRTFGARASTNAVVAQNSTVRFRNPATSQRIAVIEQMIMLTGVATDLFFDLVTAPAADLANLITGVNFDSRFGDLQAGTGGSSVQVSWGNNIGGAALTPLQFTVPLANSLLAFNHEDQEIVCLPGTAYQLRSSATNVGIAVSFQWRERPLEESELK